MMLTQYIPAIMEEVVKRVDSALYAKHGFNVYFDHGHQLEVEKNLTIKGRSVTQKGMRYPLVWMVMSFPEEHGSDPSVYAEVSLHLIIAQPTKSSYSMQQRRDEVFLPKLYPIYEELLRQISKTKAFGMPQMELIQHTKLDHPYWGKEDAQGNGTANLFNDFIDAIEIRNLKLKVKQQQIC